MSPQQHSSVVLVELRQLHHVFHSSVVLALHPVQLHARVVDVVHAHCLAPLLELCPGSSCKSAAAHRPSAASGRESQRAGRVEAVLVIEVLRILVAGVLALETQPRVRGKSTRAATCTRLFALFLLLLLLTEQARQFVDTSKQLLL